MSPSLRHWVFAFSGSVRGRISELMTGADDGCVSGAAPLEGRLSKRTYSAECLAHVRKYHSHKAGTNLVYHHALSRLRIAPSLGLR
jgi:hypothetical protein